MMASKWWGIVIVGVMLSVAWMENRITGNDKYQTCSNLRQSEIEIRGTIYYVDETTANLHHTYYTALIIAAFVVFVLLVRKWWRSRDQAAD